MPKKVVTHSSQQTAVKSQPKEKRLKVSRACVICRKKKVKCDGIQPSCFRCRSVGHACEYSETTRKRGPHKGHVEVIETRAHRIESLLSKNLVLAAQSSLPSASTKEPQSSEPVPANAMPDLVTKLAGQCPLQNAPGSHDKQIDFSVFDIPPELALVWVDHFFNHFNVLFPLLSRHHFLHEFPSMTTGSLIWNAVLALGCLYATTDSTEIARHMFQHCKHTWARTCAPATLTTAQALVIMCWHAFLSGDMNDCHVFRRHLMRVIDDLDLCNDPDMTLGIFQVEIHRRVFWVVYAIEQWLATATGEKLMSHHIRWGCKWPKLEDGQLYAIDCKRLPVSTANSSMAHALQIITFIEMIKLAWIVDHFLTTREPMTTSLTSWLLGLPSYLKYQEPVDGMPQSPVAQIYHILHHTVQILLHTPSNDSDCINDDIRTTAASRMIHIAEQMINHHQERHLRTIAALSLTLATSIHFFQAMNHGASWTTDLARSVRVLEYASFPRETSAALDDSSDKHLLEPLDASIDEYTRGPSRSLSGITVSNTNPTSTNPTASNDILESNDLLSQKGWQRLDTGVSMPDTQAPFQAQLSGSPTLSSYTPHESLASFFSPSPSLHLSLDLKPTTEDNIPNGHYFSHATSIVDIYTESI